MTTTRRVAGPSCTTRTKVSADPVGFAQWVRSVLSDLDFDTGPTTTVCDVSQMYISQLAEVSGVPATTLRYYESVGLLSADRDPTGFRVFSEDAVTRLAFIRAAKHLGVPLVEIKDLLVVCDDHVPPPLKVELRRRLSTRLGEAELRVQELTTFTDSLRQLLTRLDKV